MAIRPRGFHRRQYFFSPFPPASHVGCNPSSEDLPPSPTSNEWFRDIAKDRMCLGSSLSMKWGVLNAFDRRASCIV